MNKAYKFRLYPNSEQQTMFAKTFGCVRFAYNQMLAEKIAQYKTDKTMLRNTPAHLKKQYEWLREVDAMALANAQLQLQTAYANFFRSKSVGFPKFRSKHSGHDTYTTNAINGNIRVENGHIRLPKVGMVRIKLHRQMSANSKIKSVTVSHVPSGKYFASILTECDADIQEVEIKTAVGLDYSSPHFYVDSEGNAADMPHFYREAENRLAREQRKLSKMMRGSSNYRKQKIKVACAYEHVSNCRKDWQNKQSRILADRYDAVCVEDINLKGMARGLHLAKATNDNGFGQFRNMLAYKLAERGKKLITIDKWFPSSKSCHVCGYINSGLTLKDRRWSCPGCGTEHDRDINAAINIREAGLSIA